MRSILSRTSDMSPAERMAATDVPDDRTLVKGFVRKHYSFPGTLRLHRHAIGWDLLRAPVNVALAPLFLLSRLVALGLHAGGARQWARRFARSRIPLRTAVAEAVATALQEDLLSLRGDRAGDPRTDRLIHDYTGVRGAISEIATLALILTAGAVLFRITTPGIISLAPVVTEHAARSSAIAGFPLGDRLGTLWYGTFSVETSVWQIVAVGFLLSMGASLVTTFAGLITDPVQTTLGLHRRRLLRLLSRLDAAADTPPAPAAEHVVARSADIADAALSLWRIMRP